MRSRRRFGSSPGELRRLALADSCALARARLVSAVEELRKSSRVEKATTAIKAGYVTSIVTPMRAVAGNASFGGFLHLARHPLAAAIDVVESVGRSAATGFKVKPHEFRQFANSLTADGMGAFLGGFGRGTRPMREAFTAARNADRRPVSTFINELRLRLNARPEIPNSTVEHRRVVYDSPIAQAMTDASFAILEAADRPWWLAAYDTEVYRQSKLLAIREGLSGKALKARSAELMARPSDETLLHALDAANYATFKDRNILSKGATAVKTAVKRVAEKGPDASTRAAGKAADLLLESSVPFTGVPSSIAGKIASVSPFGILNPDIFVGGQAKRAQALANAGIGFGMVALGMKLYEEGKLTGSMPRDASERAQWNEAGKQAFSVLINGKWVGLRVLGPVASSLFMGAAMRRALEEEPEDKGAAFGKGVGASADFLTQQTYLQQIGNMIEVAKGGASVGRLAAQFIPAPALLGQVSRAADPYEREQSGFVETVRGKAGLGFMNPRRLGPTGPLPARGAVERLSGVVSPLPIKQSRDTDTLAEIRRLAIPFGLPSRSLKMPGEKAVKLERKDYEEFVKAVGTRTMRLIEETMADPSFQELSDDDKRDVLSDIVAGVRSEGRDELKNERAGGHLAGNPFAEAR
jgi:hypothetical protein